MTNRTIAVGDVHGCADALAALLAAINVRPSDTVVTLGDYIDRGPHSRDVIDQLIRLAGQCHLEPLLGNHETMLLDSLESSEELDFWLSCGGAETLQSYGGDLAHVPAAHLDFFATCRRTFETPTHVFVHANYDPRLPLDQQSDHDLLWKHLTMEMPAPWPSGKITVVGHTPQLDGQVLDVGHLICIDTYCFGGGWLTALDVDSGQVWQAGRDGRLR